MSRHLVYLNSLFSKLKGRYGEDDDTVRQLGLEVKKLEEIETTRQDLFPRQAPTGPATDQGRARADRALRS